jgi:hypothetical protein
MHDGCGDELDPKLRKQQAKKGSFHWNTSELEEGETVNRAGSNPRNKDSEHEPSILKWCEHSIVDQL